MALTMVDRLDFHIKCRVRLYLVGGHKVNVKLVVGVKPQDEVVVVNTLGRRPHWMCIRLDSILAMEAL